MQLTEEKKQGVLRDIAALMAEASDREALFRDHRQFLGFRIRWLRPELAAQVCRKNGVDPNPLLCELIYMTATGFTKCHRHEVGSTLFLTLGEEQGLPAPRGGVLMGSDSSNQRELKLEPERQSEGELVTVGPQVVHAFFAEPGGQLDALGFVCPRIRRGQEKFDAIEYEVISTDPYIVRGQFYDGAASGGRFCEW